MAADGVMRRLQGRSQQSCVRTTVRHEAHQGPEARPLYLQALTVNSIRNSGRSRVLNRYYPLGVEES